MRGADRRDPEVRSDAAERVARATNAGPAQRADCGKPLRQLLEELHDYPRQGWQQKKESASGGCFLAAGCLPSLGRLKEKTAGC